MRSADARCRRGTYNFIYLYALETSDADSKIVGEETNIKYQSKNFSAAKIAKLLHIDHDGSLGWRPSGVQKQSPCWPFAPEIYLYTSLAANFVTLTPSTPAVPNCCCSKGSAPYWSNPPFLVFDILALSPECPNVRN